MEEWRAQKRQQLEAKLAAGRSPEQTEAHEQDVDRERRDAADESERRAALTQFQCHICGARSEGPLTESHYTQAGDRTMWSTTDWHVPGDLFRCLVCQEWTCADDLVDGVCLDHA